MDKPVILPAAGRRSSRTSRLVAAWLTLVPALIATSGASGADAPAHAWPSVISGTGSSVGATRDFTWGVSPYGDPGVTATQTITSRVAAPAVASCLFMGASAAASNLNAQANVPTYIEPDFPSEGLVANNCMLAENGYASSLVFSKPLIAPIFHVYNLDASRMAITGTSTSGAAIGLQSIVNNPRMDVSGTTLNDTVQTANVVGCGTSASDPNHGACGSFRVISGSGLIQSLSLNNNATPPAAPPGTGGSSDGFAWSVSFPTAPLTKQFSPNAINAGEISELIFSITNPNEPASVTLTPLDFTDNLPAGVTVATGAATSNGSCGTPSVTDGSGDALTAGDTSVVASNISVAPGATCTISVPVTATADGEYTNDASNMSTSVGNLVPMGSTTLAVPPPVDLAITKDDGVTTFTRGSNLTYTIVVSNGGPADVVGAQVNDPLPTGITAANWTCGDATAGAVCGAESGTGGINTTADLPAGSSLTYTLDMTVPAGYSGVTLTNTAAVAPPAGVTDADTSNNTASDTNSVSPPQPSFGTCDARMFLAQNQPTALYQFDTTSNPITVQPVGPTSSFNYNSVGYNPLDNYLYALSSNNLLRIGSDGSVTNLGAVTGLPSQAYNSGEIGPDGNYYVRIQNSSNLYRIDLNTKTAVSVGLSQTLSTADLAWHNGLLYTVDNQNFTNTLYAIDPTSGQVTSVGPTGLTNALFGALFGASNGLYGGNNSGGFYRFDLMTGTATLISDLPGSGNNDGAKCVLSPMEFPVDLSITKDNGRDVVVPGETTYSIVVSNAGPFGVQNALVNDVLPAGITDAEWTCGASENGGICGVGNGTGAIEDVPVSLPVNASVTFELTLTVPASFSGDLVNTATVTSPDGSPDTNTANNTATDTDVEQPSFGTCDSTMYLAQNQNTRLFQFDTSSNPFAVDPVGPASGTTYNAIGLNPVDNYIYGLRGPNPPSLMRVGRDGSVIDLGNVANLNNSSVAGEIGPDGTFYVLNNWILTEIDIPSMTANSITLSQGVAGHDLAWHNGLLYAAAPNDGPLSAIDPETGQVTRIGNTGVSNSGFGGMFGATNGVFGSSNDGGFYQFDLTTGAATLISNLPGSSNNDGAKCVTTPLNFPADLSITKTDGVDTFVPGTDVPYSIVVSNLGPFGVSGALVSDPLPAGISTASWTCGSAVNGGVCGVASGAGAISNVPVNLPVGGSVTFNLTMSVPADFEGDLVNTATVASPEGSPDPDLSNNTATDTDVAEDPAASVAKALVGESITVNDVAEPGEVLTYEVTISHTGGSAFSDFEFIENIPNGATMTRVVGAEGFTDPVAGASTVLLTVPEVGIGEAVVVTIDLTVAAPIPLGITEITNRISGGDVPEDCAECSVTTPTPPYEPAFPPTMSCSTSGSYFNTAFDGAGGMKTSGYDDYWQVAVTTQDVRGAPPAGLSYGAATVVSNPNAAWIRSPFGNANWIAHNATGNPDVPGGSFDYFFRYQFDLDPAVDPSSLSLEMSYYADNAVYEVWVNGVAQGVRSNFGTSDPYFYPGFTASGVAAGTLNSDWRTGTNEIIVQVKSAGPAGFLAQIETPAICQPKLTLRKQVINDDGGTNGVADFVLRASGQAPLTEVIEGPMGASAVTNASIPAGTYALGEDNLSGYAPSLYSCAIDGGAATPLADNELTLANGQNAICTITNDDFVPEKALTGESGVIADVAEPGETLTYTLTLTNDGESPAVYDLIDNIDDNTAYVPGSTRGTAGAAEPTGVDPLSWSGTIVPAGSSVTVVYDVLVDDPLDPAVTEIRNAATEDCAVNPGACVTTPASGTAIPSKALTGESGTMDGLAEPGETLTFTVTLTNTDATQAVYDLVDNIDDNTTYVAGSATVDGIAREPVGSDPITWDDIIVPANGTIEVIYDVLVADPLDSAVTEIRNAATEDCAANPGACVTVPAAEQADLAITKTNGSDTYEPGDNLIYTIEVSNNGPADVVGALVNDPLPSGYSSATWSCGAATGGASCSIPSGSGEIVDVPVDLPSGSSVTFTLSLPIAADTTGEIINPATVTAPSTTFDTDLSNNTARDRDVYPLVDINKTLFAEDGDIDEVAEPGETLTYRLTIENLEPFDVTYDPFDNLDDNTSYVVGSSTIDGTPREPDVLGDPLVWEGVTIVSGATVIIEYEVTVADPLDPSVTQIRNAATEDCAAYPQACVTTPTPGPVTPTKELTAESGAIDGVAEPGETLTYTVTLSNGGAGANLYDLVDNIDDNTSYVAGTATVDGVADEPSGTDPLTWDAILVPAGGSIDVVYEVRVDDPLDPAVTEIRNAATDDCAANPDACVTTPTPGPITPSKDLTGESGAIDGVAEPGETLTYTVTLSNGGAGANLYDLVDNIDDNTSYVVGTATVDGVATEPSGTDPLNWDAILVPAGGSIDVVYEVTVADPLPDGVTEIRNAATDDCATYPDACVTTPTPGAAVPSKALTGESGLVADVAEPGETLTYTVTLTNASGSAALYDLVDNIDDNTAYVAGSARVDGVAREPVGTDPLTWDDIVVPAAGTVEIVYQVMVADPIPDGVSEIRNAATDDCATYPDACVTTPVLGSAVPSKALTAESGIVTEVAEPGETLTYTVTLTNSGSAAALYDLVDDIDANTSYVAGSASVDGVAREPDVAGDPLEWANIVVPAGGMAEIVYQVTVVDPIPAGVTQIGNIAYRRGTPPPDCETTPIPGGCVIVPVPGSVVPLKALTDESGIVDDVAEPGETLTYRVTLTNGGAGATAYDLADNIDDNTIYVAGSATVDGSDREPDTIGDPLIWNEIIVPAGGTVEVLYQVVVDDPLDAGVTELRNIAYDGSKPEPSCEDVPDQCVVLDAPAPELELEKAGAFEDANGNGVADPGETIRYTFTVTNSGNVPLADVAPVDGGPTFNDEPAQEVLSAFDPVSATIEPGEEQVFTATYPLTQIDIDNGAGVEDGVENTATATGYAFGTRITGLPVESAESTVAVALPAAPSEITVIKIADIRVIRRGEQAAYTIRVTNAASTPARGMTVTDTLPSGFRFVEGSAMIGNVAVTPTVQGRQVIFENVEVPANGEIEIRLRTLALSSAGPGEHVNRAGVTDSTGRQLAPEATATVEIVAEPVFDCSEIIGRVFDDRNRNGYQDEGEPGLPGVRLATVNGELITTDAHGRFSVPCAALPDQRIGSNFILKLDTRTLPTGYRLTTENPRVVRLTAGKMTELHFGASVGRVVRLDLQDAAFEPGLVDLRPEWERGIDEVIAVLSQEQSVLRLTYIEAGADPDLAQDRLESLQALIAERWRATSGQYRLEIEMRVETGQ